jgi:hypothetical protein
MNILNTLVAKMVDSIDISKQMFDCIDISNHALHSIDISKQMFDCIDISNTHHTL